MQRVRPSSLALLLLFVLTVSPVAAQSLTVQNSATFTVQKELDVPGDLSESAGGTLTFGSGALTLSGSDQQNVDVGPITVSALTLDNASGADAQVGGGNASVYTDDEGADLNGSALSSAWEDVETLDTDLAPGEGYMAYLFADRDSGDGTTEGFPVTLTATGPVQAAENDGTAVSPSLSYTDNDSEAEDGWNLIANPFMAPIDWERVENDGADLTNVDKTIYVWDPASGTYATYTADGSGTNGQTQHVPPFQAFFVKATGSTPDVGGIDSGDKAPGQTPEFKNETRSPPQITLRLRAEDSTGPAAGEETAVRYGEDASPGQGPLRRLPAPAPEQRLHAGRHRDGWHRRAVRPPEPAGARRAGHGRPRHRRHREWHLCARGRLDGEPALGLEGDPRKCGVGVCPSRAQRSPQAAQRSTQNAMPTGSSTIILCVRSPTRFRRDDARVVPSSV